MPNPLLRSFLCAVCALLIPAAALSQTYPNRSIRLIVPLPPGGSADFHARLVADRMTQAFGQPVLVENRPGAGGAIGVALLAKAAPDGYTIGVGPAGAMSMNVSLTKANYDPVKDFAPLSGMTTSAFLIVVSPSSPLRTLKDLIAYAKANPGKLNYASVGIGSAQHLAGELFNNMAETRIVHVPYKGAAETATAVMGGQVEISFLAPGGLLQLVQSGKLRALAETLTGRVTAVPNVLTVAEAGVPGYFAAGWLSLFAPAGTPRDIVNRLNTEIVRELRLPDVIERIVEGGEEANPTTPEELGRFVRSEIDKWAKVIKAANIHVEQ
jgi:tripartite-type tricarboxylate transporter receptor subunit TctC